VRLLIGFLILLTAVLAVAAAGKWAFWPSRNLPLHRVRHTRIRLRLRLHPGRGFALGVRVLAAVGPAGELPRQ
jgi:hypothetical protein